ncbi:MAG: Asd/ArgC dimerization domain-containing protein [Acidobacteriota bacterium]
MTRIAIVNANDLTAQELRELLEERPELWREINLLTTDEAEVGGLAEVGGSAALISAVDEQSFDAVDVVFLCGDYGDLATQVPPSAVAIAVSNAANLLDADGQALVSGVNLEHLDRSRPLISPDPAAVGLTQLLAPVLPLKPSWVSVTAVLPASTFGAEALDELFEQTRSMLNFKNTTEWTHLPGPLAFNLLDADAGTIARQVQAVLGDDAPPMSVAAVHAGVFHGLGLSVHLAFENPPEAQELEEILEASPALAFAADPHLVGPKDIAGRPEILIADLRRTGSTFTFWAVLDQLKAGGAVNALAIFEALAMPVTH